MRAAELCDEVADLTRSATDLFTEYLDARDHDGAGTRRDPKNILRELGDDLGDLRTATRELRDEIEHSARGLR
jgi:hypothetical protein